MPYKIVICDDNQEICHQVRKIIEEKCTPCKDNIDIFTFHSGEDTLNFLEEGNYIDLLFLDIEMKELNGIELGEKIRNDFANEDTQIVYISAKESYAMELFKIRPLDFLVKPLKAQEICRVIKKGIELSCRDYFFGCKKGQTFYKRSIKDILYFEGQGRQVVMVTKKDRITFYDKISRIEEELKEKNFILIHKSILVNYHHIAIFSYESVEMINNEVFTISQSRRKEVRGMQIKFERERI